MIARDRIEGAMAALADRRPVFHSEADFRFSLAWTFRTLYPEVELRLEYPAPWSNADGRRGAIGILLRDVGDATALGLEYWGRGPRRTIEIGGEEFDLRDGPHHLERYDCWRAVERLERFLAYGHAAGAYVLALTNARDHWRAGPEGADDEAFRLHEGREAGGALAWPPDADAAPLAGREAAIRLQGRYAARWTPYSRPAAGPRGEFRYLLLDVAAGLAAAR